MDRAFSIERAGWPDRQTELRALRETVFVVELRVPRELEWDGEDDRAVHLLALDRDKKPIGTARLLHERAADGANVGRIGRMAVLREWRGRGVGGALLVRLIELARAHGLNEVYLHAQAHAVHFYARYGFVAEGDEYDEAGIAHRSMRLIF